MSSGRAAGFNEEWDVRRQPSAQTHPVLQYASGIRLTGVNEPAIPRQDNQPASAPRNGCLPEWSGSALPIRSDAAALYRTYTSR